MFPFEVNDDLQIVADDAPSHHAPLSDVVSEIPALCRYRNPMYPTSRKPAARATRRRQRSAPNRVHTPPPCTDRWMSSPVEALQLKKSLDAGNSSSATTQAQTSFTGATTNKYLSLTRPPRPVLRSKEGPSLDQSPRKPHRSDSYAGDDDGDETDKREKINAVALMDVLGEALKLAEDLSGKLSPIQHLSHDAKREFVVQAS